MGRCSRLDEDMGGERKGWSLMRDWEIFVDEDGEVYIQLLTAGTVIATVVASEVIPTREEPETWA